jgi:hypothetical protein
MPATSPTSSSANYLLYSHYKALDQVQELGLIPVRLFRVLYPLWRVRVEGRQREAAEFDELEAFVERGIHEAGFKSAQELAVFFGLEVELVRKLVDQARGIGHISGDDGSLALTTLGQASVFERVRYEEHKLSSELYFETLGNIPLTLEHYKIPILESLPDKTPFRAIYHFDQTWNTAALEQLLQSPAKAQLNLPDEISAAQLISPEPVYLPVYFVEARENKPNGKLSLLVFSQVRGLRDKVLEYAVNRDPKIFRALAARTNSRAEAVQRYFEQNGLRKDAWYLNENGPQGAQVMVDGEVFLPGAENNNDENLRLTLRSVGRYTLIYDWCIWVMCDDPNIRTQAAAEQILEWLQNINIRPSQFEIRQKIATTCQRLNIQPLAIKNVLILARRKGAARAAERLEELDDE